MSSTATSPIFIGGLFKSGTSLLRAMLGQHRHIASGLETYWFEIDWTGRTTEKGEPLETVLERWSKFYEIPVNDLARIANESASVYEMLDTFLSRYAADQGKRRWLEKTPGNILHVDRIVEGWPGARILHIVRDPRDVLASLRESHKLDDPPVFAEEWMKFVGQAEVWRERGIATPHNFLELRYEALILDPRGTIEKILAFLGEPFDEAASRFGGVDGEYEKVLDVTGRESSTLERLKKPLTNKRINIWRRVLEEGEIDAMRHEIAKRGGGPLLERIEAETRIITNHLP